MFRFDPDGTGGAIIGGWGLRPEHVLPPGHADDARRRHRGDARVAHRARGADGHLRGRRGRAGGADARRTACRPSSPRRSSSAGRCGARWSSPRWTRSRSPQDAEQRISYFAELAAQALANAQAREELAASRARIVAAGDAERRRLERNLHDGAQQRLVSLALMLRLAARRHPRRRRPRARGRGAHARAAGAARARPRHPPGGADRARARAGGPRARRPRAAAGRARRSRSASSASPARSRRPPTTSSARR